MGCTTLDSMLNNWVEGHEFIKRVFGPEFEPRVGWSLDPFGPSSTQAVLQAYMGMDAWMFTRIASDLVEEMKKERGLEFVWRASSSLPAHESEIIAHVRRAPPSAQRAPSSYGSLPRMAGLRELLLHAR